MIISETLLIYCTFSYGQLNGNIANGDTADVAAPYSLGITTLRGRIRKEFCIMMSEHMSVLLQMKINNNSK